MDTKICGKCQEEKTICEFSKDKTNKFGLQTRCKKCEQEYRLKNKDKYQLLVKNWRKNNPNKSKEYYQNNKEYQKEYYEINKNKKNSYSKKYYKENKITLLKNQKEYANKNKTNRNLNEKNRRENDNLYCLTTNIRNLIGQSFKYLGLRKNTKTSEILGCSFDEFKQYIESKFESWMNWDNKGNPKDGVFELNKTWDIDHITPLSTAKTEEDIVRLNHYTNLQPLCSYVNRHIKKDNILS